MSAGYSLYGLTVESELPLPGARAIAPSRPDLVIRRAAQSRPLVEPVRGVFALRRDGDEFVFDFPDGTQVVVSGDASRIDVSWPPQFTPRYAATYLMNVVMAFVMRARGHETLHASAVLIDDAAVIFAGTSGAGKSTIAAALALRGFPLISEDVAAIIDGGTKFDVVSAHAHIRLWPDVAALLFGSAEALPLIAGAEWKRSFDVADGFAHGRFELGAIYSIEDRAAGARTPRVEPLEGRQALLDLIAASYKSAAPDATMSPEEFDLLGRMVRHVPARLVVPGTDLATLPDMIDTILRTR